MPLMKVKPGATIHVCAQTNEQLILRAAYNLKTAWIVSMCAADNAGKFVMLLA